MHFIDATQAKPSPFNDGGGRSGSGAEVDMAFEVERDGEEAPIDGLAPSLSRHGDIRLPPPADGNVQYSPKEAVTIVVNAEKMHWTKKQMGQLKKAIKDRELIPRSISSLERKVSACRNNPGIMEFLPVEWGNDRGRPRVFGAKKRLKATFDAATAERDSTTWGSKEVGDAMTAILRENNPAAAAPSVSAIQAQIGLLANQGGTSLGVAKGKATYRYTGEGSERSMLADAASNLATQIICDPSGAPAGRAVPADVPEGVRKSLEIYAEATGASIEHLYFVDPHGLVGTDDSGLYYYKGDASYDPNEQRIGGPVGDSSYSRHQQSSSTNECNGVVGRFTNSISFGGYMAPVCLVFPNCSAAEIPLEAGYHVMKVKGLCIDGNINAGSENFGYVVHICKGKPGVQSRFFNWYAENIEKPFCQHLRDKMGHTGGPVTLKHRIVLMKDGAGPQMDAVLDPVAALERHERQEVDLKSSKGRTAIVAACDTGTGHRSEKQQAKRLSKESLPSSHLVPKLEAAYKEAKEEHGISFAPAKLNNMISLAAWTPTIKRKSYSEDSIQDSFVKAAIRCKSGVGYDVYDALGKTLRKGIESWKREQQKKWIRDLPAILKEMLSKDHVSEAFFQSLGYQEDTDLDGNDVVLTASVSQSVGRQRACIPNGSHFRKMRQDDIDAAKDKVREKAEAENQLRQTILNINSKCAEGIAKLAAADAARIAAGFVAPADASRHTDELHPIPLAHFFDANGRIVGKEHLKCYAAARSYATSSPSSSIAKIPAQKGSLEAAMRAVEKRRANPHADLTKDENNLIFFAWSVQSKPVTLELAVEEATGEVPMVEGPVVQEVGFGHQEPDIDAAALIGNQGWVDMCKADVLGVLFQNPSESIKATAAGLRPLTLERFQNHLDRRIERKELHSHASIGFVWDNLHVCDALAALAGHVKTDPSAVKSSMSLLRSLHASTYQTVAEDGNSALMGAYLYHDPVALDAFFRSGSACNEAGDATMAARDAKHAQMAASQTLEAMKSCFYSKYPKRNGGHGNNKLRNAYFDDIVQYVAMGFNKDNGVDNIAKEEGGIFVWSVRTLKMLERTKMNGYSMESKKLVLVAYLFELYYDLLIAPSFNVSGSAGLERFIGVFTKEN